MKRSSPQATLALKALGEPRRLEILELLRSGPRSVGEIADQVDVTQQAVSQHLAVLDRAGLVEARREGTRSVYVVRPAGFAPPARIRASTRGPRCRRLASRSAAVSRSFLGRFAGPYGVPANSFGAISNASSLSASSTGG